MRFVLFGSDRNRQGMVSLLIGRPDLQMSPAVHPDNPLALIVVDIDRSRTLSA